MLMESGTSNSWFVLSRDPWISIVGGRLNDASSAVDDNFSFHVSPSKIIPSKNCRLEKGARAAIELPFLVKEENVSLPLLFPFKTSLFSFTIEHMMTSGYVCKILSEQQGRILFRWISNYSVMFTKSNLFFPSIKVKTFS